MNYWTGENVPIQSDVIMVFGSNPQGRHGKGAALAARFHYGAMYGVGRGLVGNSYALPTKNLKPGFVEKSTGITYETAGPKSINPKQLLRNIIELYEVASANPSLKFYVIYKKNSGNLNGYSSDELFRLFIIPDVPENVYFHDSFIENRK